MQVSLIKYFAPLCFSAALALAQSAQPTANVLTRTFMVQSKLEEGTIFSIDVDGREYWITAKHILTGGQHAPFGEIKDKAVTLKILSPNVKDEKWIDEKFAILDPGKDIDIAVLAAATPILENPLSSAKVGEIRVSIGGDCTFLGFPYGGAWKATFSEGNAEYMPFIKHCGISAILSGPSTIWVLDGINNIGFSGGPVLFKTGNEQAIFAVISGYRTEPADVVSSGTPLGSAASTEKKANERERAKKPKKQQVNLNSGFIFAYSLKDAVDAIRQHPIGPLRSAQ